MHHPFGRRELSVRTFLYIEKLWTAQTCIHPDVSAALPDDSWCSTSFRFLSRTQLWEVRCNRPDDVDSLLDTLIHKASIAFKSKHLDGSPLGSDTCASDMEIVCIRSTVLTTTPLVRTREALVWKLLAAKVRPSGRQSTNVWPIGHHRLDVAQIWKEFQRNFWKANRTVVRPDALWLPSGWGLGFIKPDAYLNLQPINRGP